jgi:hypothetical protein
MNNRDHGLRMELTPGDFSPKTAIEVKAMGTLRN